MQISEAVARRRSPRFPLLPDTRCGAQLRIVPSPANKIILLPAGTEGLSGHCANIDHNFSQEAFMGRGILLWLLGIPIPIIILIMLFVR